MNNNHHTTDDELRLIPQDERFPVLEKLKRAENEALNISRWEELCIGMAEDCLSAEEAARMQALMKTDEATREQVAAYRKVVLKNDSAVLFPGKESLKHRSSITFSWKKVTFGTAAAAIMIVLLSIYVFRTEQHPAGQNSGTTTPELAAVTVADEPQQTVETNIDKAITPVQKAEKKMLQPDTQKPVQKQPESKQPAVKNERTGLPEMKRLPAAAPVLLASATPAHGTLTLPDPQPLSNSAAPIIELVKVQGFFDRMTGELIVGVNRLLNKETVVVKEFNLEGTMTYYAVHSSTFEMQRNYNKQRK